VIPGILQNLTVANVQVQAEARPNAVIRIGNLKLSIRPRFWCNSEVRDVIFPIELEP
jgi:hypothetical protein